MKPFSYGLPLIHIFLRSPGEKISLYTNIMDKGYEWPACLGFLFEEVSMTINIAVLMTCDDMLLLIGLILKT